MTKFINIMRINNLRTKKTKKIISFVLICGFSLIFNGCLFTGKLWYSYDLVHEKQVSATSNQIYYSCSKGNCNQQKILLPYKLNPTNKIPNGFPPFEQGFILIQNKKCISSTFEGVKALVAFPSPLFKNASIQMNVKEVEKSDKLYKTDFKCNITAELLNRNFNPGNFDEHQSLFQYKIAKLTQFKGDGSATSKDIIIFSPGEKACKNNNGWIKADMKVMKDFPFTANNDNWLPILSSNSTQSFSILFMSKEVENVYQQPAAKRILLTPFAIIADIFLIPILIFTGPPA